MIDPLHALWPQAISLWLSGGWAMIALALNAIVIFGIGMHVFIRLRIKGFRRIPEHAWRRWIRHPEDGEGPIAGIIAATAGSRSVREIAHGFTELRKVEIAPFDRDLRLMRVGITAAPLMGLLGTVIGMLTTFDALSTGSGGEETMARIAGGISEALVTTETGLVIALVGLFFQYQLARTHERYRAFLARLESACTQHLHRRLHERRDIQA